MKTSYMVGAVVVVVVAVGAWWYVGLGATPTPGGQGVATTTPGSSFGMVQYTDTVNGFSFWYPSDLLVTASTTNDSRSFPGGVVVETLQVGPARGTSATIVSIAVVHSPTSSITDEPNNHASPIGQTKYFYVATSSRWMVAYPDSASGGSARATTTADVSQTTMSGLTVLPSGRRFDTSILPLTMTTFLVVSDGGASSFTPQLVKTIAAIGTTVDATTLSNVLRAEAAAYASQ